MADRSPRCSRCVFWLQYANPKNSGQCRRWPPQLANSSEPEDRSWFPRTGDFTWCGEFKDADGSGPQDAGALAHALRRGDGR